MGSCENTWAGRFVIGLQLFSWCAVGALLLHKGISSIKDDVSRAPKNDTEQHSYRAETNLSDYTNSSSDKSTPTNFNMNKVAAKSDIIEKHNTAPVEGASENNIDKETGNVNNVTDVTNSSVSLITPPTIVQHMIETRRNETSKKIATPKTPSMVHNVRVPPSRSKYDLTPSGAVMATIGAIMLILGPTIVAVRCCESYVLHRRFNKLSANDHAMNERDLPPSYEEVEGRAPRYSMLFLDAEDSTTTTSTTIPSRDHYTFCVV